MLGALPSPPYSLPIFAKLSWQFAMEGELSFDKQGCASKRPGSETAIEKLQEITIETTLAKIGHPQGKLSRRRRFWLLFLLQKKVTRPARAKQKFNKTTI